LIPLYHAGFSSIVRTSARLVPPCRTHRCLARESSGRARQLVSKRNQA